MPKVIVERGRIRVLEPISPYDDLARTFLATMVGIKGVIISGYVAILLGRPRQTEDIDMFLAPMGRAAFDTWWDRLEQADFWCLNAGREGAWGLLEEHLAPRFARTGTIDPNVEVKIPRDEAGLRALDRAWRLELLGQDGWVGDLSEQIAYKLYMATADHPGPDLRLNKDLEDGLHIARVAGDVIDQERVRQRVSILGVPNEKWEAFRERAGWV